MAANIEISVVILCYKTGKKIHEFVDRTIRSLEGSVPSWELVLVGNYTEGSDDDTPAAVREIASKMKNVKAITLPKQGMMGWDARSGLRQARGNYICLIDGDGQMPPEDIIRVYEKIKKENLDFATTYRIRRGDGIMRMVESRIYNILYKMLFPGRSIRDLNSKPKILTKHAYNKMALTSNDWFLDTEIIIQARRLRLKMGQVSTKFYKCDYRKSFIKFNAAIEFIINLSKARIREFRR
jgi:glycosyltransferase involved in cell wall biosynthesis